MEKLILPDLPVLDDFNLFLTFLRTHQKIPVTGTSTHLKQADLFRLNPEMHFKADWVTEKSRQPHYPLLDFFYHVVIAAKLVQVRHEKKGVFLQIVPENLERYENLTSTEKFFFLLETTWCYLNWEELTGARSLYFAETVLQLLYLVAESVPGQVFEVQNRTIHTPDSNAPIYISSSQKVFEVFWFLGFYDMEPDASLTKRPESHEFTYTKNPQETKQVFSTSTTGAKAT